MFLKIGRNIRIKEITPIYPIILFVFSLNCFRGSGEIVFHYGPIIILKQGIVRGVYFSLVILEIFFISKLLTRGFPLQQLLSMLYSIDIVIKKIMNRQTDMRRKKPHSSFSRINIFQLFFYVLNIFQIAYSELKIFFKVKEKGYRNKIVQFFNSVFWRSLKDYENKDDYELFIIKPGRMDYIYGTIQILLYASIFLMKGIYT